MNIPKATESEVSGFITASGKRLINGQGREIILRGVGLGSWLLPEGYMWRLPAGGDRPRRIEKMTLDLLGSEKAYAFWEDYYDNYITEEDIRRIAAEGFNSVRLPVNSRYLLRSEQAINRIDSAVDWCRKHRIYIILDLHGAPGGQTGANIDDSEDDYPRLFTDRENAELTVKIWQKLAGRYKDEWIVAGYDLLNEPLPEWFSHLNDRVMPLYREIIAAVRHIDQKHMIILEGVHWATDWSIFTDMPDDNLMLQFHKYWNNPDEESIKKFLDAREKHNVPIFMGEGGENNTDWYAGAFQLFDDLDISWNFWTWKKMDTGNSPVSVKKPAGWKILTDFIDEGIKPSEDDAESVLKEYLENIRTADCDYRSEVVRSILRRAPLRIPAIFYSYKGTGTGFQKASPNREDSCGFRETDGVKMGFTSGELECPNFEHGGGEAWKDDEWMWIELNAGDWFNYEFTVGKADGEKEFGITLKMSAPACPGAVKIIVDSCPLPDYYEAGNEWTEVKGASGITPGPGVKQLRIEAVTGPVRIERIIFDYI